MRPVLTARFTEELFTSDDKSRIDRAEISQPLCTALQLAMIDLLRSFAIRASVVVGHSSGEIAAASVDQIAA